MCIAGKNSYYCNENEYIKIKEKKELKDNMYNTINQIFGRKVINTILFKEIGFIETIHGYKKISQYLLENEKYLTSVLEKDFNSEYAQIRYFSAILKNSLSDFKMEEIRNDKKEIQADVVDMRKQSTKKRRGLSDVEDDL